MVTITNGIKSFRVPTGAVKPYENMGFHVVSDDEVEEMKQGRQEYYGSDRKESDDAGSGNNGESREIVEKSSDDIFVEELLEKPLSQWNNEEVKEFVRIKDIDTSGAQKVSQVRSIIKTYLEEQSKNA